MARRALQIFRSLRDAGLVSGGTAQDPELHLTVDLPPHFALNQPLSAFSYAAVELLDPESDTYARDAVSVVESTLDDPRPILYAQQNAARRDAIAEMKAEGIEYEERMERLESVTYPKPLAELLDEAFALYVRDVPWAADFTLSPKSVVRAMVEGAHDFRSFVGSLGLNRSEGTLLRYLSDAYRALRQTLSVPEGSELEGIIEWLGAVVRGTDSSLVDEWSQLVAGSDHHPEAPRAGEIPLHQGAPTIVDNRRSFTIMVRNELFRRAQYAAVHNIAALGELDAGCGWTSHRWQDALDQYFDEYASIGIGQQARSPQLFSVNERDIPGRWVVRQVFDDPDGDRDWGISAEVDLSASAQAGSVVLRIVDVGPYRSLEG